MIPGSRWSFSRIASRKPDGRRQDIEAGPGGDLLVYEAVPAVAIVHDAKLNGDRELLNAAGAVAVLAAENAELDAGCKQAMGASSAREHARASRR